MTTKQTGAVPKKGPPARVTTNADRALTRAFDSQRVSALTADVFLRSQGPKVVDVTLPNLGAVVLMKRIDLYDHARRGTNYYPFRSAIYSMISDGGLSDRQVSADGIADTLDLAARIALDTIVVPPPEYTAFAEAVEADVALHEPLVDAWEAKYGPSIEAARMAGNDALVAALMRTMPERPRTNVDQVLSTIEVGSLRPLFVEMGEDPGPGQIVLRYAIPDDDGTLPGDSDLDGGGLHPADLITILRAAHRHGPGALGRRFRGG